MKKILTILILLSCLHVDATIYYVRNGGSDGANGTSTSTAWQTLDKVNATTFTAGDVILFRRGDTFYGKIIAQETGGVVGNPISYGAYGSGAKPIITGFTSVTSWTNKGANIWETTNAVSTLPDLKMVLINGKSTPMGRYPNGDASYPFLPNFYKFQGIAGTGVGASSITSTDLSGGYDWTGADVVMRVNQWSFHREVITSHVGSTISFSGLGSGLSADWGFFIQNDIRTLDQPGEWYYNPSTKKISVYSVGEPTDVQISTVDTLFYLYSNIPSVNSTDVDNINFTGANTNAIWISGNLTFSVTNCDISYSGLEGMLLYGGGIQSGTINDNTFYNCGSSSIFSTGSVSDLTITNNDINLSGIISVYKRDDYSNGGIAFSADNSLVQYNTVDSSAYCGINFNGADVRVINNFINHSALVRGDAAGIYSGYSGNTGKIIEENIILNSVGNIRGTQSNDLFAFGIYSDDLGNHMSISNNTIANCTSGLYIHNSNNLTVRNNTIYNTGSSNSAQAAVAWANGSIAIDGNGNEFSNTVYGNTITNNIIFATNQYQYGINYYSVEGSGNDVGNFGTIDSNYYVKINSPATIIKTRQSGFNGTMSLAEWRTFSGTDANSKESPKSITDANDLRFEYNATNAPVTIDLSYRYIDVAGTTYNSGSVILQPYSSIVLIKNGNMPPLPVNITQFWIRKTPLKLSDE